MSETDIARLAVAIRSAVNRLREANLIATKSRVRVKRRDFNLKYSDDLGFTNFEPKRSEVEIWDWPDQDRFHKKFLEESEEFASLAAAAGTRAFLIESFVRTVSFESFHGLDDQELRARSHALACELAGKPLPIMITAFINGLSVSESPLRISDAVTLRKPMPDDFAEYIDVDEYGSLSFPSGETWFRVVGEFSFAAVSTGTAQKEFLRTIEALRLFRVGG